MPHKNIPIFIPHVGCPHRCTFCDQRAISGHGAFDFAAVGAEIERALATLDERATAEIAYFGGSFTAIDRNQMIRLLDLAERYVASGRVAGIRFSTRPDAVGEDVLDILSDYTVTAVELGLQSMDDGVLARTRRGHTAAVARDACRRIVRCGYPLVGQMMIGLPGATPENELRTAEEICALGATAARVYPTVVFDGTALADELRSGTYIPPDEEETVARCAAVLRVFEAADVRVLRIGLCASETLRSSAVLGGANHPAMGELVLGRVFRDRMQEILAPVRGAERAVVAVPAGRLSQAIGQKRGNISWLTRACGIGRITVCEDASLHGTSVRLRPQNDG